MPIPDCPAILKLSGTWIGAALANIGSSSMPMVAALPMWAEDLGKWGGILAIFLGCLATFAIFIGQMLKNIRTMQEIKVQQRKDLHDIQKANDEAVCLHRRLTGECPMCKHQLLPEHTQPEIHDRTHEHDHDRD